MLNFITRNQSTARHEMLDGRDYLVVPGVPAREQVMNDYLVPADELSHFYGAWNGVPIVIDHPQANDGSANAVHPDVPVIGRFYNAGWDEAQKRLTGEYWIDVHAAQADPKGKFILDQLEHNQMLETSTGYWADEVAMMGQYNGVAYQTIHRNLRPDHIAILPQSTGACSLMDGCGLNRNERTFTNCDKCPHKNQVPAADMPPYKPDHLPRMMLEPYTVNKGSRTAEQLAGLRAHMKEHGIDTPVMVMRRTDGSIQIKDGNHRVAMAKEFGIDQIPVECMDENLQPLDAKALYSEWAHKQDQGYLNMNQVQYNALSKARTPSYSGTESTSWDGVTKTVQAFASAWMKHGGKMPQGGMPKKISDMPAACLAWIAGKTLLGDPKADNPGDLMMFPVVNPNTNKLNAGALRAVLSGRGAQADIPASALGSARNVARRLLEKEFSTKKGHRTMKLNELIEELKGKGVVIKVNEAAEDAEDKNPSFELESFEPKAPAAQPDPDDNPDDEPKPDPLFTQEEAVALKSLAKSAPTLLKDLPAAIRMAQNAETREKSEKAALVSKIKANQSNVYSDAELDSMSLPVLTKLDAQMSVNYSGFGSSVIDNAAQGDEIVVPPAVLLAPVKEK